MNFDTFRQKMQSIMTGAHCAGGSVALALSGGVDSVVLAHLLFRMKEQGGLENLLFLHFNHCLRGSESDGDEVFCAALSEKYGAEFCSGRGDVKSFAENNKLTLEEAARELRYEFFVRSCTEKKCKLLLTAHHRDDQAETVLFNINRGSGLRGLCGMPQTRALCDSVTLARPLLWFSRAELEAYSEEHSLEFRQDKSNFETVFERNRLRHDVLPELEARFSLGSQELARLSDAARRLYAFIEAETDKAWDRIAEKCSSGGTVLCLEKMSGLHPEIRAEVLRRVCSLDGRSVLESRHVKILNGFISSPQTGKRIELPHCLVAEIEYGKLRVYSAELAGDDSAEFALISGPDVTVEFSGCKICCSEVAASEVNKTALKSAGRDSEFIDAAGITFPLKVRKVRDGDRFTPLGAPGSCLVSDYFTNKKIPRRKRAEAVVVEDAKGIVWLCPHIIAERVKIRESTMDCLNLGIQHL